MCDAMALGFGIGVGWLWVWTDLLDNRFAESLTHGARDYGYEYVYGDGYRLAVGGWCWVLRRGEAEEVEVEAKHEARQRQDNARQGRER